EDRVVGVVDLVDVGSRRRRLLGLGRCVVRHGRLGHLGLRDDRGLFLGRWVDRRVLLGRWVDRLLVFVAGWCLGSGDVELPADVDDVGVGQLGSAGLGDAGGGLVDLGPAVGVAELLLGDLAEGVAGLYAVLMRGG